MNLERWQQELVDSIVAAHREGRRIYVCLPRQFGRSAIQRALRAALDEEEGE